jgi:hypothetical protein
MTSTDAISPRGGMWDVGRVMNRLAECSRVVSYPVDKRPEIARPLVGDVGRCPLVDLVTGETPLGDRVACVVLQKLWVKWPRLP